MVPGGFWRRLFGVGDDPAAPPPPEITSARGDSEDFVDLVFALERDRSGRRFVARGRHRARAVAFAFDFGTEWAAKELEFASPHSGSGALQSVGEESDAFVAVLAELYGQALPDAPMLASIPVDAIALGDDPDRIDSEPMHFKLFFHPNGSEQDYAEVYLNIDVLAKRIEFNEKDPDYREPLLRALTSRPASIESHVSS